MTNELLLNLIFYIIITPVIGTTLTKLMFMSENNILVADAIARMEGTTCGPRPTSCPDQIAQNLKRALAEL